MEYAVIRKLISTCTAVIGLLISGYGFFIFALSLYHHYARTRFMGSASIIGFYWGLILIGVGLIPLSLGIILFTRAESFLGGRALSKRHQFIILITFALVIFFLGLNTHVSIIKEDKETCQTYYSIRIYNHDIGGRLGTYQKVQSSDFYAPRPLLSKEDRGLYSLIPVVKYKFQLVLVTLAIGFAVFMILKKK